ELQRSDPEGKEQWGLYCESHSGGVRDPNKHDEEFLQMFIDQFHLGGRIEPVAAAASSGGSLCTLVKIGQRKSQNWRQAWTVYCQAYGGGVNDPSRHEAIFLVGFLDFMAQRAISAFVTPSPVLPRVYRLLLHEQQVGAAPVHGAPAAERPLKRPRMPGLPGAALGASAVPSGHPVKDACVAKIKAFQRSSESAKQTWWEHCDQSLSGIRDPMRHEASSLEVFVTQHNL
ncbi:unnamed protein product, partial [Polarella glacialis]